MSAPNEVISKDIPGVIALLSDVKDKLSDVNQRIISLTERVDNHEMSTEKGVSFLEMKFHLLLSYLINLVHYMLLKTEGRSIENNPTVDRMVELRTVMEKIRPIDQKLKYQVDKLIKIATTGRVGQENDPLRFKPRPENLISKLQPTDGDGADQEDSKPGIYVPPKVAAVPYDDDKKLSKRRKSEESARRKALKSSLLRELRDEYSKAPEEFKEELFDGRKVREKDEDEHQKRYEEENFVRLLTKRHGKSTKEPSRTLDDLTKFTDLSILAKNVDSDDSDDEHETPNTNYSKKKRKSKSSGKSRSGKKFKGLWLRKLQDMTSNQELFVKETNKKKFAIPG